MFTRTLSRLATTGLVAGALIAVPSAAALAVPARDASGATLSPSGAHLPVNASGNVTAGTDVAAADQQNPIPAPAARPVPQAPTWPENPQPLPSPTAVSTSTGTDFQWDDAGIGAGGALAIVLAGLGGVAVLRRRGTHGGALAA
jgi:hypothetical protein